MSANERSGDNEHGATLTGPEQLAAFVAMVKRQLKGDNLYAYSKVGIADGTAAEIEAYEQQKAAAKRSLRKEKYEPKEMDMSSNAGRILVEGEMEMLDNKAQGIIQKGTTSEQRAYLLPYETAAAQFAAIQMFYGGQSLERQENIKARLVGVKYQALPDGQGMRNLITKMTAIRDSLVYAGGTLSDRDLMAGILSKIKRVKNGDSKRFGWECKSLLRLVSKGAMDLIQLRDELVAADIRYENDDAHSDSSVDESEAAPASVPAGSVHLTEELLQAMITKTFEAGANYSRDRNSNNNNGKRNRQPRKKQEKVDKECFNFRDTGVCRFGDNCNFNH